MQMYALYSSLTYILSLFYLITTRCQGPYNFFRVNTNISRQARGRAGIGRERVASSCILSRSRAIALCEHVRSSRAHHHNFQKMANAVGASIVNKGASSAVVLPNMVSPTAYALNRSDSERSVVGLDYHGGLFRPVLKLCSLGAPSKYVTGHAGLGADHR